MNDKTAELMNAELMNEIRGIKDEMNASENRMTERFKNHINSMENRMTERFKEIEERIPQEIEERMTKKLNPLKEKMSLMEDKIAFYGHQATGGGMPKEVRRVPSGYGLLEPRSTWRRERYGR